MNIIRIAALTTVLYLSIISHLGASPLQGKINKNNINIRSDSTTYGEIIGTLKRGDIVRIVEEKFNWYKITLPPRFIVYANKNYLKRKDNTHFTVTATVLNLRSKASISSPIIGKVKKGTILRYAKDKGVWVGVYGFPHAQGWVHKKFVDIIKLTPQKNIKAQTAIRKPTIPIKIQQKKTPRDDIFIARGKLFKLNPLNECPANYKIKNGIVTFFLDVNNNVDNLAGKEVVIQGKRHYKNCPYIEVEEISPLK